MSLLRWILGLPKEYSYRESLRSEGSHVGSDDNIYLGSRRRARGYLMPYQSRGRHALRRTRGCPVRF